MSERLERIDMADLLKQDRFLRFLSRVIQMAGIHAVPTPSADGRGLLADGRRDLGLSILHDVARGQEVEDPETAFALTLIQVLNDRVQLTAHETPRGRRKHYDDDDDTG